MSESDIIRARPMIEAAREALRDSVARNLPALIAEQSRILDAGNNP